MRIWKLDADRLEVLAIKRPVDHIAAERRSVQRVPTNFNVPVVPGCLHVLGSRKRVRRRFVLGRPVVDPNFVEDERVSNAVCPSLKENNVLQVLRLKSVNGCGSELGKRNPDLNPTSSGQVAGEFSKREWLSKTSRQLGDLQSLACMRQNDEGKTRSRNRLWRKARHVKVFSRECREAIGTVDDSYCGPPSSQG